MQINDAAKYSTLYLKSKAEIIINESDSDEAFGSVYSMIISNIQKSLGKGLGWIIDSVTDHTCFKPQSLSW